MDWLFTTTRLGFRPWQPADLPLAQALWADAAVSRFLGGPFSAPAIAARLQTEIACATQHGIQYWPIFLLDGREHAGCAGLHPYGNEPGVYELGYHLRPAFWGRGLALEAARAVLGHAFTTLNAAGLFAGHHPVNLASGRILTKLGFHFAGMQFYEPFNTDEPTYRLTQAEWRAQS